MRARARSAAAMVLAAGIGTTIPASAKQPHPPSERLQILPDESESFSRTTNGRVSDATGVPIALYRVGFQARPGTPEEAARQYVHARATELGMSSADLAGLRHRTTSVGKASSTVRFEQTFMGVPVFRAETAVSVNRASEITFVMNGYRRGVSLPNVVPSVAAETARAKVVDHLQPQGAIAFERQDLVVYQAKGASRLAHRFRLIWTEGPSGEWEGLVDAQTGELFRLEDISCKRQPSEGGVMATGTGTVFAPDPLSSAGGAAYGSAGLTDGDDADTAQLTAQLAPVTLPDIELAGGLHTLRGPFAEIIEFEAPATGLFSQASNNFNATRNPQLFEAANTYYHIDRYMRYINTPPPAGLGLTVMPTQYVGGARFDPHGFNGADNSHYLSGPGVVAFGEGGVDDDEDADVIIHELGHALHDWVVTGSLSQVQGLSEGTGDYFAQSYSRAYGNVPQANPAWHWVFNWDGHNPFWGGRTTNWPNLYPGGLTGQIHTDGQIWATSLMRIWNQLGAAKTDSVVLEGLRMTNSGTNQDDAAQACMQAAFDLGLPLADQQVMLAEFTATGYTVVIVPVELMSAGVE